MAKKGHKPEEIAAKLPRQPMSTARLREPNPPMLACVRQIC